MDGDRQGLIGGWWEYQRLSRGTRDERLSIDRGYAEAAITAYQHVADLVDDGSDGVVQLLVELNRADPDHDGATVGAGPLEDLVHAHGDRMIDELERQARQDPSFRKALSTVWIDEGALSLATHERLQRLVQG
jgi:hypothetical protein